MLGQIDLNKQRIRRSDCSLGLIRVQSDQGPHCLPFHLQLLSVSLHSPFQNNYGHYFQCHNTGMKGLFLSLFGSRKLLKININVKQQDSNDNNNSNNENCSKYEWIVLK